MKLKQIIKDYFSFTRNERIGLIILICLIFLFMLANHFIFYFEKPTLADRSQLARFIESMNAESEITDKNFSLFKFNPNTIDSLALDSLELPSQVKRNILKYRDKGGHFNQASDLKKIYGMNDSVFNRMVEYIIIKEDETERLTNKTVNEEKTLETKTVNNEVLIISEDKMIDLNHATAEELESLSGIGEKLSVRIIKYRDLLGGFYSADQLSDVYGMSKETIDQIRPKLTVDTTQLKKININFSEWKELVAHPYLEKEDANKILKYISKNGYVSDINLLEKDSVLDKTIFEKIKPYLKTKN